MESAQPASDKAKVNPKVNELFESLEKLSIGDAMALCELFKSKHGIDLAAAAPQASGSSEGAKKPQEASSTITVQSVQKKLDFIKAYKKIAEQGLIKTEGEVTLIVAKKASESLPLTLEASDTAKVAEIKKLLEGIATLA